MYYEPCLFFHTRLQSECSETSACNNVFIKYNLPYKFCTLLPNTLCHIGIQAPLNGIALPKSTLLWVIIACIIPDLPWIQLKLLLQTGVSNPYDLRLYSTAQASLLFCLLLSAGLSLLSKQSLRVFLIVSLNSLAHLLLDALQIKWGNGVNLISPLHWEFVHLDLFWPEYSGTILLTIVGFLYLLVYWKKIVAGNPLEFSFHTVKCTFAVFFILLYYTAPIFILNQLEDADTYYIHTLRTVDERPGKPIKFDRAHYAAEKKEVTIWSGEKIALTGELPKTSGRVSFSGVFLDSSTLHVKGHHFHKDHRDVASLIGLIMACTLVAHSLVLATFKRNTSH